MAAVCLVHTYFEYIFTINSKKYFRKKCKNSDIVLLYLTTNSAISILFENDSKALKNL